MNHIQLHDLGYSLRRHFVDQFHLRHVQDFTEDSLVLDLGGNRVAKRGLFDIDRYGLQVVYANLSTAKEPHVRTDAAILPFAEAQFDAVICSELLEHVPEPLNVVREIHRVLKPKGSVIICVPFMNKIHGDPYDYGRYTDFFWNENLSRLGFQDIEIEKQGLFWSVLVDMIRDLAYTALSREDARGLWLLRPIARVIGFAKQKALEWDKSPDSGPISPPRGFTTGFGIRALKA